MNRKKSVSVIAIILAVLMLLSLVVGVIPMTARADELDSIEELQKKRQSLSLEIEDLKTRIAGLREQESNVLEQMVALKEQYRLAQEQINLIDEEIEEYERRIEEKGKEVDRAKNREAEQLERYRNRIRAMEESGGYNILAVILESDNLSQMMTAIDDMGEIMESDKQIQHDYESAREETEEVKAQYEEEKTAYEHKQEELVGEQKEIYSEAEKVGELLISLQEEIEEAVRQWEAAEAAEQAAAETISNVIASYNARKASEQAAQQAAAAQAVATAKQQVMEMTQANSLAAQTGMEAVYTEEQIRQAAESAQMGYVAATEESGFVWPLPCSYRVTSRFGNRIDPFTGETRYHSGIDIDGYGNDGAPVVAAASGTVITASYDGAYGNYVIIDHGSTSTVYAHLSGLAVSVGDSVNQGATIGYVGSTGRATGTHLHFEVYVGDGRVDPAQYFSGISYYNC